MSAQPKARREGTVNLSHARARLWINSPEAYSSAGAKCARAREHHDEALAHSLSDWFERALRVEQPEVREQARRLFNVAYREARGAL